MIRRLVILDTKTTGIPYRDDSDEERWVGVVELGAVVVDTSTRWEDGYFQSFVRPWVLDARALPALDVNKIQKSDIRGALDSFRVARHFLTWLMQAQADAVTSFNMGFDRVMLERMGLRFLRWDRCLQRRAAEFVQGEERERFNLETRQMEVNRLPSLARAVDFFSVTGRKAHRALDDARMAAGVWRGMEERS